MTILCAKILNIGLDLLELFKHIIGVRFFETQCSNSADNNLTCRNMRK